MNIGNTALEKRKSNVVNINSYQVRQNERLKQIEQQLNKRTDADDMEVLIGQLQNSLNTAQNMYLKINQISIGNPSNIHVLERQVADMKKQLSNCVPICLVIYLVACFTAMIISLTLFILKYAYGVYITKDFYLISAFLISITLFFTALVAVVDWRRTNKDGEEKRKQRK